MQGRQFSNDTEIARVGGKFLDRSLPKPEWTHAAHFAVSLWLVRHRSDLDLNAEMPGLIRAFNEATGTPNTDTGGYHETITIASLRAVRAALAAWAIPNGCWIIGAGNACFRSKHAAAGCRRI
jgi:hypothetical protein